MRQKTKTYLTKATEQGRETQPAQKYEQVRWDDPARDTRSLRNPTINFSPRTQERGYKADLPNPFPVLVDAGRSPRVRCTSVARGGPRGGKSCGQARRLVRSSPFPHPRIGPSLSGRFSLLSAPTTRRTTNSRRTAHTVTHTSTRPLALPPFPLSTNPSHRPPGDLAGNQTRGSHSVHSRTKDSHPRRRSTTSSYAVSLPSDVRSRLVSSKWTFRGDRLSASRSKATASLTW